MLLTLTTSHRPATDLGFLLHKNPARVHELELAFGRAHMFYSEATDARCTFALLLDIDPVSLVRGKSKAKGKERSSGLLDQYVNDRPYAASSFLSVAIARGLRTALGGGSKERPELAEAKIALEARVVPLPARGADDMVLRLFQPLGYDVTVEPIALDSEMLWLGPEWARGPYVSLTLCGTVRLRDLLTHLYVLIPVLDKQKHYFVARDEIDKLVDKGAGWLGSHPERQLIATRYLRYKRSHAAEALARLAVDEDPEGAAAVEGADVPVAGDGDAVLITEPAKDAAEIRLETPIRLHDLRLDVVAETLKAAGARRIVDLGCGSGKLLKRLMAERQFDEILGVDISSFSLELAERRLRLDRLPERQRRRIRLIQGALTYRDKRIEGYDAAALVEVIEHLDPERLSAMARVVFEFAKPSLVVVTTPNREYNAKFEGMTPGQMRHADHRFEWTRAEFEAWARPVAETFSYRVRFAGLGEEDAILGAPSQLAVFERIG